MFLGVYRLQGAIDDLVAGYERLLQSIPHQGLHLHVCAHDAQGLWIYDACPTKQAFVSFANSDEFRQALKAAGLPTPEVKLIGEVHAAFWAGQRRL